MRLARAEEARDPDPDLARHVGIVGTLDRIRVGREELAEVLVEFLRDDELVEFLPDGRVVQLVGLHDAVDRAEDVTGKEVFDQHRRRPHGTSLKAR